MKLANLLLVLIACVTLLCGPLPSLGQENAAAAINTTELYVFDFFSSYSGDCADLQRTVQKAESRFAGRVKVFHVDVDNPKNQSFITSLGVQAVPTLLVVNPAGEQLKKLAGHEQGSVLLILLQTLLPETATHEDDRANVPATLGSPVVLTPEIAHSDPGS
jgi:thioredoxin-like negative regulator of GroEL